MFVCAKLSKKGRADLCLLAALVGIALLLALALRAAPLDQSHCVIVVEQDGKELARLPWGQERTLRVESADGGYNLIVVGPEGVSITEADCPDQLCVKQGLIDGGGQSIICLPHRLCVRLVSLSGQEEGLDALAQ